MEWIELKDLSSELDPTLSTLLGNLLITKKSNGEGDKEGCFWSETSLIWPDNFWVGLGPPKFYPGVSACWGEREAGGKGEAGKIFYSQTLDTRIKKGRKDIRGDIHQPNGLLDDSAEDLRLRRFDGDGEKEEVELVRCVVDETSISAKLNKSNAGLLNGITHMNPLLNWIVICTGQVGPEMANNLVAQLLYLEAVDPNKCPVSQIAQNFASSDFLGLSLFLCSL
ncbi:hypothetical protein Acr_07g0013130 [Actinidia rufa]|uniref:Uncharacterized protein n=1 Tax=Actinidia rufa TaxID=165716 RepID=A0A7J0EZR1_9ERIC|nr:hypothetical protein Acr_07g0013130 [Actinidia rufa]